MQRVWRLRIQLWCHSSAASLCLCAAMAAATCGCRLLGR
jgi:hypothetical protein